MITLFKPVAPQLNLTLMEEEVLRFWKRERIFARSGAQRAGGPEFVFYEGPPTANGKPGVHHVLARAFKDLFPRYKTMRGYHVVRRGGWDTHGLPVEIEVEKRLGFHNKGQIEAYGIERFNALCRKSAFEYIQDWERLTERIAFWVDLDEAYVTYTNEYIESVWWILRQLWDKGLLYQGDKVVPYCPRCGTPLSDHEVAQGYRPVQDPSLYVRLPLADDPDASFLVWTTTPWTLPGNVAVAAHPQAAYAVVRRPLPEGGEERLILARERVEQVFAGEAVTIADTVRGKDLSGLRYKPLFTFLLPEKPAYRVVPGEFVNTGEGSGLVHLAPAFGAEDLQAAGQFDLPHLQTVAPDGTFISEVRPWRGMFVRDADPLIAQELQERGLLLKSEAITHSYPFCWRCDTPLIYYNRRTWYLRTTAYKDKLVALNQEIHWVPAHIREGRFGNWLANNVDWALGRERYWGTPLPVWVCAACRRQECIGSVAELSGRAGRDLRELDLHRPFVDEVTYPCPVCGGQMRRVAELIDAWFDSGAMPLAQWHYPFENQAAFQAQFPADFICEAVDQTRGWFYSLHAISTLLFEQACFRNAISLGLVLDGQGQKMSKRHGNLLDPWQVIEQHGADAFRWYLYTASPPGQERRFSAELVGEVVRNFTLTLWNVYSFFVTYANLDGWEPTPPAPTGHAAGDVFHTPEPAYAALDRWLLSELHSLVRQVTQAYESYDVPGATRPIQTFVEALSRWYLRRSRRRFWKSEADAGKRAAYHTLYTALVTLCKLLAPAMPILAEALYQNLVCSADPTAPQSVHLADWPEFSPERIDESASTEMALVMKLASLGHAARNQAGIKVRQPLAEIAFALGTLEEGRVVERYAVLLAEELNIKKVRLLASAGDAVTYQLNPRPRQLGSKYQALYPQVREAILALDAEGSARALLDGHPLYVNVAGQAYKILPEEVEVRAQARAGLAVAAEGPYLAALVTELTPDLAGEGLAREFVRRVQDLRKRAGLQVTERIRLYVQATPGLQAALEAFRETICEETLAVALVAGAPPAGLAPERSLSEQTLFDGEQAQIGILRI